jgi:hypothetical protein
MNPGDEKTLAVARRTKKNLEFIYAKKEEADVEEFTQLINSMLGMLICVREDYTLGEEISWQNVQERGLQRLDIPERREMRKNPDLASVNNFNQWITNIRHALAHNNYELLGDPITHIRVWTTKKISRDTDREQRRWIRYQTDNWTWEAVLSEDELYKVANTLLDYLTC